MATNFSATITLYPIINTNSSITLDLEEKQLVDFSFTNSDRNDYYLPSWGVCSNGGSLTFKDDSGDILAYSMQGYLQKKAKRLTLVVAFTVQNVILIHTKNLII